MPFDSAHGVAMARVAQAQALLRSCDLYVDALDASSLTLVGSKVSAWANKGTAGGAITLTQSTDANRPAYGTRTVNGRPVIDFDRSSSQYLTAGDVLDMGTGSLTSILVGGFDDTGTDSPLLGKASNLGTAGHWGVVRVSSNQLLAGPARGGVTGRITIAGYTTTTMRVMSQRITRTGGVGSNNLLRGLPASTPAAAILGSANYTDDGANHNTAVPFEIGRYGGLAIYLDGPIGLAAVARRALTDAEIATIEWYLSMVWLQA